jgi:UTP--glucose-1-phosphate uridylyltransferase
MSGGYSLLYSDVGIMFYTVSKFLEKPKPEETSSRLGVIGKYIITPEVFDFLKRGAGSASKDGEIRLADAFEKMVQE